MKQVYCQKEAEIIRTLRRGGLDAELEKHAATCAICADTLAISEFLQGDKNEIDASSQYCDSEAGLFAGEEFRRDLNMNTVDHKTKFSTSLPDPDFLWWKAQLASKQAAVERATRSIALVRTVSYCGAAATGLWLVFAPGHLASIVDAISKSEIWSAGVLSQSAVFLGVGTLVFTLVGSLYLARPEK